MKRLVLSAIGLALSVWAAGCANARKPALHASDYQGTIRVACVGDSITFGAGATFST